MLLKAMHRRSEMIFVELVSGHQWILMYVSNKVKQTVVDDMSSFRFTALFDINASLNYFIIEICGLCTIWTTIWSWIRNVNEIGEMCTIKIPSSTQSLNSVWFFVQFTRKKKYIPKRIDRASCQLLSNSDNLQFVSRTTRALFNFIKNFWTGPLACDARIATI